VLLYLAADSSGSAAAQTVPRLYPDPGYRCLGVYGGGPSSHFDYRLIKLHLDDSFRDKKQWWQNLKAGRATDGASPHDVFLLYPGIKRGADLETARRRIDAWLKSEPEAETYPQLIPAVCIEEENVRKHDGILDALARHIRQSYGVAVFQWYSMPIEPNPALTADGWILDAYGMPPNQFRKHLMKFVALRRPVLCVPWASDPQWPGWKKFASAEAMIDAEWHQFDACLEFNVSPAVFAVAGAGSVNAWLASNTPQMVVLRDFLAARRAAMHAFRPGELPLASAGFSARDEVVSVGGDPDEPSAYVEQFDGFRWIHDASLAGFQHMRLGTYRRTTAASPSGPQAVSVREVPGPAAGTYRRTTTVSPSGPQSVSGREVPGPAVNGRTYEFGGLELMTIPGEVVAGSLVYRLESFFPLESVRVLLQSSAPAGAQCHNQIALARDEAVNEEPLGAVQTSA